MAENESASLADYFVPTYAYESAVAGDAIYVGHRGTGKTASAQQAFEELSRNPENLAVLIKPPGFEFPAILDLLGRLPAYQHDYFLDALWRFVLQTEIAATAIQRLDDRGSSVPPSEPEAEFLAYVDRLGFDIRTDISVRIEQALTYLSDLIVDDKPLEAGGRNLINEALHDRALAELRTRLGRLLSSTRRVAVFVDNLDKGWEKGADFHVLARLVLGLLTARGKLVNDFHKQDQRRKSVKLTVAVFLRSDIYNYMRTVAREPDKLPISTITWGDPETLLSVIDFRYAASTGGENGKKKLWKDVFIEKVGGTPTRKYITSIVLPRPRDIVYFCNLAIARALDRRHAIVDEDDLRAAEAGYSQYAYEALLVENGVTVPEMSEALLSFLGSPRIQTRAQIMNSLQTTLKDPDRAEKILNKLVAMSFLGIEVHLDDFQNPEVGSATQKAEALAARLSRDRSQQRLAINRAFHAFLEIQA